MKEWTATPRTGQGWARCHGTISGYVFKLIRESTGLTQTALAEQLLVDVATIQGWESGRRWLGALRSGDLTRLRMRMSRLGAPPETFGVLHEAIEGDLVISDAVEAGNRLADPRHHSLAASVHRQSLTSLITWPLTGVTPKRLASISRKSTRRGPTAPHPVLGDTERRRLFDHLLVTADGYRDEGNALLRRQAIYLLGFDLRSDSADWLTVEQHRAVRQVGRSDCVPSWVTVRSSAVALARGGNRDPLQAFVSTGLNNDIQETANLNYWAYWVGEGQETYVDDDFMLRRDPDPWPGSTLLLHLLDRLTPGSHHTDLNVHTVWALLLARTEILGRCPRLGARLRDTIDRLAAEPDITSRTRRELSDIAYAVRLADR